jgi:hypothetical protein
MAEFKEALRMERSGIEGALDGCKQVPRALKGAFKNISSAR